MELSLAQAEALRSLRGRGFTVSGIERHRERSIRASWTRDHLSGTLTIDPRGTVRRQVGSRNKQLEDRAA